ncbi:hypothetical protein QEN19_001687 [Hanseniaspora menglaensis]
MTSLRENIISKFQYIFKPSAYYDNLILKNDDQINEYLEFIHIDMKDENSKRNSLFTLEELGDKIFNLVCTAMIKQRDSFLIHVDKELDIRNMLRIRCLLFFYFLSINTVVFLLVSKSKKNFSAAAELFKALCFSLIETLYMILIDLIFYRLIFKYLKKKLSAYCYEVCDQDIKDYYDTRGSNVFGTDFLTDFIKEDSAYNIQLFKDKSSSQLNSVCILKPIEVSDEEISMTIGFVGTLTDKKLKFTILDKMFENLESEFMLLKEGNPNKKVTLSVVLRGIETELIHFLVRYKGFKKECNVTNDFKWQPQFNKVKFVKRA